MSNYQTRRIVFHLAPLLDMLLFVFFAQYLQAQLQVANATSSAPIQELEGKVEQRDQKINQLDSELNDTLAQLAELRLKFADLNTQHRDLNQNIEDIQNQQERLAGLVTELFQVPAPLVAEVLNKEQPWNAARSEAELQRLQQEFQELAQMEARKMVKHIITQDELRKRCDIWEVEVDRTGNVSFRTYIGQPARESNTFNFFRFDEIRQAETREERRAVVTASAAVFSDKMFTIYQKLPDPKSLVIILFTESAQTNAAVRDAALQGLQAAAERMEDHSRGRTRFEYTRIGFLNYEPDATP